MLQCVREKGRMCYLLVSLGVFWMLFFLQGSRYNNRVVRTLSFVNLEFAPLYSVPRSVESVDHETIDEHCCSYVCESCSPVACHVPTETEITDGYPYSECNKFNDSSLSRLEIFH